MMSGRCNAVHGRGRRATRLVPGPIAGRLGRILLHRDLGPARATAVALAVTTRIIANGIAELLVAVYLTIRRERPRRRTWLWFIVANVILYVVAMVLLTIIAVDPGPAAPSSAWRFLDDDRPVSDADRAALLRLGEDGVLPGPTWIVAAAIDGHPPS